MSLNKSEEYLLLGKCVSEKKRHYKICLEKCHLAHNSICLLMIQKVFQQTAVSQEQWSCNNYNSTKDVWKVWLMESQRLEFSTLWV